MSFYKKSSEIVSSDVTSSVVSRRKLLLATLTIGGASLLQIGCGSVKQLGQNNNPNINPTPNPNPNPNPDFVLQPQPNIFPSATGTRNVKLRLKWPEITRYFSPKTKVVKVQGSYMYYNSIDQAIPINQEIPINRIIPIKTVIFTKPESGTESIFEWIAPSEIEKISSYGIRISLDLTISTHESLVADDIPRTYARVGYTLGNSEQAEQNWILEALPSAVTGVEIVPFELNEDTSGFAAQARSGYYDYDTKRGYDSVLVDPNEWEWTVDNPSDFRLEQSGGSVKAVRLAGNATTLRLRHKISGKEATYPLKRKLAAGVAKENLNMPYIVAQVSEDEQTLYALHPQSKTPYKWTQATGAVAMETGFDTLPLGYVVYAFSKNGAFWGTIDKNGTTIFVKYPNERNAILLENPEGTWGPVHSRDYFVSLSDDYSVVSLIFSTTTNSLCWTRQTGWQQIPEDNRVVTVPTAPPYNYFRTFIEGNASSFTIYIAALENSTAVYQRWQPSKNWEKIALSDIPQTIRTSNDLSLSGLKDYGSYPSTLPLTLGKELDNLGIINTGVVKINYPYESQGSPIERMLSAYISKNDPRYLIISVNRDYANYSTYCVRIPSPLSGFKTGAFLWKLSLY
jgi:hypothetical protein